MLTRNLIHSAKRLATSRRQNNYVPSIACFSTSTHLHADFTHAIIGGGAIGLAIARQLTISHPESSTLLIERHGLVGSETSSRNSEVIHAGLYYPPSSLKTKLCIRGKGLLYDLCEKHGIGHRRCGKWVVAQDGEQYVELEKIFKRAGELDVPVRWVGGEEAKKREPHVRAAAGVLESLSTGIVDSHGYMQFLEGEFVENGGMEVLGTAVEGVERLGSGGFRIFTRQFDGGSSSSSETETKTSDGAGEGGNGGGEGSRDSVDVEVLINAAGLHAIPLSNTVLPKEQYRKPHYAKGTYFSYASRHPRPGTLVYPAPQPGLGGLGTHLTLDLSGRVRFGPDVEWIESPSAPGALTPSTERLKEAVEAIKSYLPDVQEDMIEVDYCGIRPKLGGKGTGFQDFYIKNEGDGFVNLLGIESPGLTASLAIGEYVERILYGSQDDDGGLNIS